MPSCSDSGGEDDTRFLLPQGVGDTEDVEGYRLGGLHPVQLNDRYDDGRYQIVHKLGAGGFSTVWLARDESEKKWVALKIVDADHSVLIATKSALLRSGEGPFSNPFEVTTPLDLMSYIIHTLGEATPPQWQHSILWDSQGQPTRDASKGMPHDQWWDGKARSLQSIVHNIWDEPKDRVVHTGISMPERRWRACEHQPFPPHFSDLVWNPKAVKVDNVYLSGYGQGWDELVDGTSQRKDVRSDIRIEGIVSRAGEPASLVPGKVPCLRSS